MDDEFYDDYIEEFYDNPTCVLCGNMYCPCCGCDCLMDDYYEEEFI